AARDGLLATAGWGGKVSGWRVADGARVRDVRHAHRVAGLTFSPDGRYLNAASARQVLRTWDVRNWQHTSRENVGGVLAFLATPDDPRLVALAGHEVRVWGAPAFGPAPRNLDHRGAPVTGVAFRPDGRRLATTTADGRLRLWDVERGRVEHEQKAHDAGDTWVAFSPTYKHLATGGKDGLVRIWDGYGKEVLQKCAGHRGAVTGVAFEPAGRWLASAGGDGTVRLLD